MRGRVRQTSSTIRTTQRKGRRRDRDRQREGGREGRREGEMMMILLKYIMDADRNLGIKN